MNHPIAPMSSAQARDIDQYVRRGHAANLYEHELKAYVLRKLLDAADTLSYIIDAEAERVGTHKTERFTLDSIVTDLTHILEGTLSAEL